MKHLDKTKGKEKLRREIKNIIISDIIIGDDGRLMNYHQVTIDILYLLSQELLKMMPKEKNELWGCNDPWDSYYLEGYNQALSDIKKIIKGLGE